MRFVDLSAPIKPDPESVPAFQRTEVEYLDHAAGAAEIETLFGVTPDLLRDGEGWTRETLTLGTHNSTHVDAPWHYNSTIGGNRAETIDELPLEWFFGPGVVLDFHEREDGEAIDAADLPAAFEAAGHELEAGDIVLVRSGRDAFYGHPDYISRGPGVTAAATHWLYDRGVRVMGIDAWGWDRPLDRQAKEAVADQAAGVFWEAHQTDLRYSQIERLVGLDRVPQTGFTVSCFPLPVVGASAAPARVVAMLDE
jgi:kynurenine formamidase